MRQSFPAVLDDVPQLRGELALEDHQRDELLRHDDGGMNESLNSERMSELESSADLLPEIEKEIHERQDCNVCTRFFLSNARSLAPKITSLIDYMYELQADFSMITETWFKGGKKLDAELSDIEQASGIRIVCRNRGKLGGGVAIAFNTSRCNLKKRTIKSRFEMLCVTGKIAKIPRQFAIFVVYVPPSIKTQEFHNLTEDLAVAISEVKVSLSDPVVIVGGDFNKRNPSPAFESFGDLERIPSGATRGDAVLDIIYSNVSSLLLSPNAEIHVPLQTEDGNPSDHGCVMASLKFPAVRDFEWVRVVVRLRSDDRNESFRRDLQGVDWSSLEDLDADCAVREFERVIASLTDRHFPFKSFRRRSNEKPWITNAIRKKSRRKRRIFRKHGRSEKWRSISRELEEEVRVKREEFVDQTIEKGGQGKDFFAAVKKLSGPGSGSSWSVGDLYPGKSDAEVCRAVVEYFSSVGAESQGQQVPFGPELPAGLQFTPQSVLKRLKAMKKKDSHVEGDPLPHLVRLMPELFAVPVCTIFNKASETSTWPEN